MTVWLRGVFPERANRRSGRSLRECSTRLFEDLQGQHHGRSQRFPHDDTPDDRCGAVPAEYNRFSKGIFAWVGFNTKWIPFENRNREAGTTKWSFWGLLVYAIDGILAFSTAPLALSAILGLAFCAIAIIMIFVIIWKTLAFGDKVAGWPSLACILCFTAGISMFCNGVIGLYVSKTYSEVKGRPQYILKDEKVKSQQKSLSEK